MSSESILIHAPTGGSSRRSKYDFDVFIHYDQQDHDYVFKYIISPLEKEFNCIFEANAFLPSRMKDDCIEQALQRSYWTIIVYSKKSVKSGHTTFLYHQSLSKTGGKRLLAIRIDECKVSKLIDRCIRVSYDCELCELQESLKRKKEEDSLHTCNRDK